MEGLRSLGGEHVDHGPIEVLDGEVVPPGALVHAMPDGARLYEATGNEGALIELQYRHAVLVIWRRNDETLRMLARCGGRLAVARELTHRLAATRYGHLEQVRSVLTLWKAALATDGAGPVPDAHRLLLDALDALDPRDIRDEGLRERYVIEVASVDLDAAAVPTIVNWIRDRLHSGTPVDAWVEALREACGTWLGRDGARGASRLLRALCDTPDTQPLAVELLADLHDRPMSVEGVQRHAALLDEVHAKEAWRRRRTARMASDD